MQYHDTRKRGIIMSVIEQKTACKELLTIEDACEITSLGKTKVRELANDSKTVLKIGKSYRIKKADFLDYINKTYSIN